MIAKELADYLEDRSLGTVGTDIFIGRFPKTIQKGIYLVQTGGVGQDAYLDTYYENIDIWSVNTSKADGYSKLEAIARVLSRATNYSLSNYFVYYSQDVSGILDMDRTAEELALHKITIRIIYRNINLIS